MIIHLPNTETREIASKIDELHEERGEAAIGRVLTLLISCDNAHLEESLALANAASREHPCRVIAVVTEDGECARFRSNAQTDDKNGGSDENNIAVHDDAAESHTTFLDAEVRFGADAGAGEIIVLRPKGGLVCHPDTLVIPFLVPDAPVVTWWPTNPPEQPSQTLLGGMARSCITDAVRSHNPQQTIANLRNNWDCADIDLSWTRLTVWRAMLATLLDQPPHLPITAATITGPQDFLPLKLLAAWLRLKLDVPVTINHAEGTSVVVAVELEREDGTLAICRPHGGEQAYISTPNTAPQQLNVPVRTLEECLSEELRRLDPDTVYAEVITQGWELMFHE